MDVNVSTSFEQIACCWNLIFDKWQPCCVRRAESNRPSPREVSLSKMTNTYQPQVFCMSKTTFSSGLIPSTTSKQRDHIGFNDNYEVSHCFEVVEQSLTVIYRQVPWITRFLLYTHDWWMKHAQTRTHLFLYEQWKTSIFGILSNYIHSLDK